MKAKYLLTLLATLTLVGCGNNPSPQGEPPITPPDPGPEVLVGDRESFLEAIKDFGVHQYSKLTYTWKMYYVEDEIEDPDSRYETTTIFEYEENQWVVKEGTDEVDDFTNDYTASYCLQYAETMYQDGGEYEYTWIFSNSNGLTFTVRYTDIDEEDQSETLCLDSYFFNDIGYCTKQVLSYITTNVDETTYESYYEYFYQWE